MIISAVSSYQQFLTTIIVRKENFNLSWIKVLPSPAVYTLVNMKESLLHTRIFQNLNQFTVQYITSKYYELYREERKAVRAE